MTRGPGGLRVARVGAELDDVPLAAGDVALWPGPTVHASEPNTSEHGRPALIAYYVRADAAFEVEPCRPQ